MTQIQLTLDAETKEKIQKSAEAIANIFSQVSQDYQVFLNIGDAQPDDWDDDPMRLMRFFPIKDYSALPYYFRAALSSALWNLSCWMETASDYVNPNS